MSVGLRDASAVRRAPASGQSAWIAMTIGVAVTIGIVAWLLSRVPTLALLVLGVMALLAVLRDLRVAAFVLSLVVLVRGGDVLEQSHGVQSPLLPFALLVIVLTRPWRLLRGRGSGPAVETVLLFGSVGLVLLASTLVARELDASAIAIVRNAKAMFVTVAVVLVIAATRSVRAAVWGLIVGGLMVALVVDFQSLTGAFDRDFLGLAKAPVKQIVGEESRPRAAGPIGDPNFFAQSMVVVVALALERFKAERRLPLRAVALAAAAAAAASVMYSFSRGGFVGLVAVVVWSAIVRPRSRTLIALVVVVTLAALPVISGSFGSRLAEVKDIASASSGQQPDDGAVVGRASLMMIAARMFADHPLIGVGAGNFKANHPDYATTAMFDSKREPYAAHSLPLEVAAETGLVGLAVFVAAVALALARLRATRRALDAADRAGDAGMLNGLSVALVGYLICSAVLHGAYPELLWLLVGMGVASPVIVASTQGAPRWERVSSVVDHRAATTS